MQRSVRLTGPEASKQIAGQVTRQSSGAAVLRALYRGIALVVTNVTVGLPQLLPLPRAIRG